MDKHAQFVIALLIFLDEIALACMESKTRGKVATMSSHWLASSSFSHKKTHGMFVVFALVTNHLRHG